MLDIEGCQGRIGGFPNGPKSRLLKASPRFVHLVSLWGAVPSLAAAAQGGSPGGIDGVASPPVGTSRGFLRLANDAVTMMESRPTAAPRPDRPRHRQASFVLIRYHEGDFPRLLHVADGGDHGTHCGFGVLFADPAQTRHFIAERVGKALRHVRQDEFG